MTDEERKLLEMSVRGIMEKRNNHVTDADVAEAMELLLSMDEGGNDVAYQYEHPDYGAMVKEVPDILRPLLGDGGDDDGVMPYDQLMGECSKLERSTLADAASSVIYFWLDKWHKGDNNNGNDDEDDYDDEVWTYPVHVAILMVERFKLRECLPALLEMDRQQRDFATFFFEEDGLEGMIGACIYQIATTDRVRLRRQLASCRDVDRRGRLCRGGGEGCAPDKWRLCLSARRLRRHRSLQPSGEADPREAKSR